MMHAIAPINLALQLLDAVQPQGRSPRRPQVRSRIGACRNVPADNGPLKAASTLPLRINATTSRTGASCNPARAELKSP